MHTGTNGHFLGLILLEWDRNSKHNANLKTELLPIDDFHGVKSDHAFEIWQQEFMAKQSNSHPQQKIQPSIQFQIKHTNQICSQECRTGDCLFGKMATDSMRSCLEYGLCKL
jgi:hypothetical protein